MLSTSITTSFGSISIWDTQGKGPVALFLHGNSLCKEIFQKQFISSLAKKYRFIAIDFPGHGKSDNASHPEETYTISGYATVVIAVMNALGIRKACIVGWALGGHVAINLLQRWPGVQAIMITGTSSLPQTAERLKRGYPLIPYGHLFGKEKLSLAEGEMLVAQYGMDFRTFPFLREAVLRTDGNVRLSVARMMQKDVGEDQKKIVEGTLKPVAIVEGDSDTLIDRDFFCNEKAPTSLWKRKVHFLTGGHAIFWKNEERFNAVLENFLDSINKTGKRCQKIRIIEQNARMIAVVIFLIVVVRSLNSLLPRVTM